MSSLLRNTLLKPTYSLRRQLLLSFGSTALLSLVILATVAVIIAHVAGNTVKGCTEDLLNRQIEERLKKNSLFVAETIDGFVLNFEGSVHIVVEVVRDRIVGYPDAGWENDTHVPFVDHDTGRKIYPLKSRPLPLDFEVIPNVNVENAQEHLQERAHFAQSLPPSTLGNASYVMQGTCDPNESNSSSMKYYPDCIEANNDVNTGGVVRPTRTNKALYEKSADIGLLLKPLFESHPEIILIGVYFVNSGAGSVVHFPGHTRRGDQAPYVSMGCDWMNNINPRNNRTYGTKEEIARCRPNGTLVAQRDYNPSERQWFQECAQDSNVQWFGPYYPNNDSEVPVITVGQSIFDRLSGNLIGCVGVHMTYSSVNNFLRKHTIVPNANISIVRLADDGVMADSFEPRSSYPTKVTDTDLISSQDFIKLKNSFENLNFSNGSGVTDVLRGETAAYLAAYFPFPAEWYAIGYIPHLMIIQAIPNDVFDEPAKLKRKVKSDVRMLTGVIVVIGLTGIVSVLFFIWYVCRVLTEPLLWIESIAWRIVNHEDKPADSFQSKEHDTERKARLWGPTTELTILVTEFKKMTIGFSGSGAATVAKSDMYEIKNEMTWQSDYQQLYAFSSNAIDNMSVRISPGAEEDTSGDTGTSPNQTQQKVSFLAEIAKQPEDVATPSIVLAPPKKNVTSNFASAGSPVKTTIEKFLDRKRRAYNSSLFWWILILIALPLALTNVAMCLLVSTSITSKFPEWQREAASQSKELEKQALTSYTSLKATQAEMFISGTIRDLHFTTRLVGWLLFDGVSRSSALCDVEIGGQECASSNPVESCPFFDDPYRAVCACSWDDLVDGGRNCRNFTDVEARAQQRLFYFSQAIDADNATGDRYASETFGSGANDSPNTTRWWDNIDAIPGSSKGNTSSGYETAYDRLRVSSAIAIAKIPLYNHQRAMFKEKEIITSGTSFEADGMTIGYSGCNHQFAAVATFQSTKENNASEIAPDLCPEGKFGFDPRCRHWYFDGKKHYMNNREPVHITPPYQFALASYFATTATSPIANPSTGVYLGQVFQDYRPHRIRNLFNSLEDVGLCNYVITPESDVYGGNTVVQPRRWNSSSTEPWKPTAVEELMLQGDDATSNNTVYFKDNVLSSMKNGEGGIMNFTRLNKEGEPSLVILAFAPAHARVLLPLDPSEFSRGVTVSSLLVYSVAIGTTEHAIDDAWQQIEKSIEVDLKRLMLYFVATVGFVSLCIICIMFKITVLVTQPMLTLLTVVETINTGIEEDIPPLLGGSTETTRVYNSFSKLYKIVRVSNVAFFSGNLLWAYSFILDSLKLYRRIGDEKAIGIACNNLGNTLHAMCADPRYAGKCCAALPGICTEREAEAYYKEAIDIARSQLAQAGTTEDKALFTQQLSDRLFNRGLYLLLVADDKCAPIDARRRGLEDIKTVREQDDDVTQYLIDRHLLMRESSDYFLRLLRRSSGLLNFYDDKEIVSLWDANDIITEADRFLFAAWNQPLTPLFNEVSPVGRLQQLEATAIQLDLIRGRDTDASRLAMRMFAEDSFLMEKTFSMAATALLTLLRNNDEAEGWTATTKASARADFRKMLRYCKNVSVDVGKCFVVAVEVNERWEGDPLLEKVNESLLKIYDECCLDDDHVGVVAYTTHGDLNVPLGVKGNYAGLQRTNLDLATTSTSERACPSFPYAIQTLLDSAASTISDSFIVLLTDGNSWDGSSYLPVKAQIDQLNRERETKIHVIILGMNVDDEGDLENSDAFEAECKLVCKVSKASFYVSINLNNVDGVFEGISQRLRGEMTGNVGLQGITMEKF